MLTGGYGPAWYPVPKDDTITNLGDWVVLIQGSGNIFISGEK
jgi:hypothetical protein